MELIIEVGMVEREERSKLKLDFLALASTRPLSVFVKSPAEAVSPTCFFLSRISLFL